MDSNTGKRWKRVNSGYDFILLFLVIFICGFGLLMIYSSSAYNSSYYYNDEFKYLRSQALFCGIGFALMFGLSFINVGVYTKKLFRIWKYDVNLTVLAYVVCLLLEIYLLINGQTAGGSERWIELPVIGRMQPSDAVKGGMIVFYAYVVSKIYRNLDSIGGFLGAAVFSVPILFLVAKANLSTGFVILLIILMICFAGSGRWGYYPIVILAGVGAAVLFVVAKGYRMDRIFDWLHPDLLQKGDQIFEGRYAIASGGFFGKGFGRGVQKLGYIPEVHTDMIFAIICEELGVIGAMLVMALYIAILWRIYLIALSAATEFGSLICVGVFTQIAVQFLANIAVVTELLPATGINLPFISSGGSSLIVMLMEIGLVLSVSRQTEKRD